MTMIFAMCRIKAGGLAERLEPLGGSGPVTAEIRTGLPLRTTTIPVSVWIAVYRTISAVRRGAASDARHLGFFA